MQILAKSLSAFMLLAAFATPAMAYEPPRISLTTLDDDHLRLDVSGTWPNTCPPQLLDVSAQGRDVQLLATRETEGCHTTPTPYAFSSAPLSRTGFLPENGIHRVRLTLETPLEGRPMLAGFALLHLGESTPGQALETGFWWAEQGGEFGAGPGLGLSVETQGGLISLSVMGYAARGDSAWYFGAGELADGIAHLDLAQFKGGAGPFARYAAPEAVNLSGYVDVETLTPSRAVLWFSRVDAHSGELDLRPLSIVRFSFAQEPGDALLGRWLVAGAEAGARETRWVAFVRSEPLEDGFILHDADGTTTLHCDTPHTQSGSPPTMCRMDMADGDSIEFTDVALRRLSGWDAATRRSVAFRLD